LVHGKGDNIMAENYRVLIKRRDQEIEVESTDKSYVETKLKELLATELPAKPTEKRDTREPANRKSTPRSRKTIDTGSDKSETPSLDVAGIVTHIKDSDDYQTIETNIFDRRDQLARIMMCMHFAKEFCEDAFITTGQIEAITNQFGVKVGQANAANKIRDNQKYFTGKTVRKKGQVVPYKLNRQGEQKFQEFLKNKTS
jgi:hypothetical protein